MVRWEKIFAINMRDLLMFHDGFVCFCPGLLIIIAVELYVSAHVCARINFNSAVFCSYKALAISFKDLWGRHEVHAYLLTGFMVLVFAACARYFSIYRLYYASIILFIASMQPPLPLPVYLRFLPITLTFYSTYFLYV